MIDFCVLGSGVSGSTIANLLNKRYKVLLLDKAQGIGGRASNKTYKSNISFDHGLQYFSPNVIAVGSVRCQCHLRSGSRCHRLRSLSLATMADAAEEDQSGNLEALKRSMQYALIKNCDMNEEMRTHEQAEKERKIN